MSGAAARGGLSQDRLIELVRLRFAAKADEKRLQGDELVRVREHPDGGPAATQCRTEAVAIGVVEPEVLVVELAQQRATRPPTPRPMGPRRLRTTPAAAPLPPLVAPTLCVLSLPCSSSTRTATAS